MSGWMKIAMLTVTARLSAALGLGAVLPGVSGVSQSADAPAERPTMAERARLGVFGPRLSLTASEGASRRRAEASRGSRREGRRGRIQSAFCTRCILPPLWSRMQLGPLLRVGVGAVSLLAASVSLAAESWLHPGKVTMPELLAQGWRVAAFHAESVSNPGSFGGLGQTVFRFVLDHPQGEVVYLCTERRSGDTAVFAQCARIGND